MWNTPYVNKGGLEGHNLYFKERFISSSGLLKAVDDENDDHDDL